MSRLSVQLVAWNGAKYIPHLFRSLRGQTVQNWDFVVIDNGSKDETVALIEHELETLSQFRAKLRKELRCQFVRNVENRGFAGGHNQAFEAASSQPQAASSSAYIQLLNQDTVLAPEYFERLVEFMKRTPTCAAAQGALLRWDFPRAGEPDGGRTDTVDTLGLRVLRSRRVVELGTGERLDAFLRQPRDCHGFSGLAMTQEREVFGVSGALPMYRRAALEDVAYNSEIFDTDFFSYKEDVDLAFRLRSAGWSAHVVPSTRAWHDRTAAGPRELSDAAAVDLRRSKSPLVRYHSYKNQLLTLVKNEHPKNFARHWPWVVGYEFRKLAYVLLREPDTLRALREVWRRLPAMRAKRHAIMAKWKVAPAAVRKWFV